MSTHSNSHPTYHQPLTRDRRFLFYVCSHQWQARPYLEKYGVQEALASAVAKVIKEQPTDPVASIARYLMQVETQRSEARMMAEIATMSGPQGFDFLIVCCSNLAAENYWQKRLESTVKEVTGAAGVVRARATGE